MAAERPPTVRKAKANERIAVLKDDCFTRARKRRRVGLRSSRNFVELDEDEEDDDDEKDNTPIVEDKSDGDYEDDTTPRKKKKLMREKSLREEDEKKIASQKHWLAEFEEVLPIVRNFPKSAEYRKFRALEPAQKHALKYQMPSGGFSQEEASFFQAQLCEMFQNEEKNLALDVLWPITGKNILMKRLNLSEAQALSMFHDNDPA